MNGVISSPFEQQGQVIIVDFYGNSLTLPTISAFSLLFSTLSMLKTVIALNILGIYTKVINHDYCRLITTEKIKFKFSKLYLVIISFIFGTYQQETLSCELLAQTFLLSIEHLPFFISSIIFRLSSIILCATYLNIWALIPVGVLWFSSILIGYIRYVRMLYINVICKYLLFSY